MPGAPITRKKAAGVIAAGKSAARAKGNAGKVEMRAKRTMFEIESGQRPAPTRHVAPSAPGRKPPKRRAPARKLGLMEVARAYRSRGGDNGA